MKLSKKELFFKQITEDSIKPLTSFEIVDSTGIETLTYLGYYVDSTNNRMELVTILKKVIVADGYRGLNLLGVFNNQNFKDYRWVLKIDFLFI